MKKILCILLSAIALAAIVLCGCDNDNTSNSTLPNKVATTDQPATETTVSTTGNKIHINDNTLGEIWITELEGVNVNKLQSDGFTSDSNFKYYSENGAPASTEGIDISNANVVVDWEKVKNSGIDFVMVRIGGRGYGEAGNLYPDDKALEYINAARKQGLKVGGYFFSQAVTTAEAVEEADYVKELLGDIQLDYPLAYDWEIIKDDEARTDTVSAAQATECALAFCQQAASYGYKPMIYSASREFYFKYDLSRLADYPLWYVEYADVPNFYYEFSMWQYSENGTVDGIDGAVDLNICFTNVADYD